VRGQLEGVVQERLGDEQPRSVDQQRGVGMLGGQLLAHSLSLHPVGQVGGDAVGRAILGQDLDGVVDLVGVLGNDDGAATGGHDVGGGLAAHPAAAADHRQFLPCEDGHGHRPAGPVPLLHALKPVHGHSRGSCPPCARASLLLAHG
jgi:hypothetical protein